MLQGARANGCPWNGLTCFYAVLSGHREMLKWARENGAPVPKDMNLSCLD